MSRTTPFPLFVATLLWAITMDPLVVSAQRRVAPTVAPAPEPVEAPSTAPVETETETEDPERVARELFRQGRDAYTAGRFEDARELFQRSYDLSGRPGLLYNIAQAAERTRDDEHALRLYGEFLEAVPDAPERDFVEARIAFLSERVRTQQAAASDDPEPDSRGPDLGPLPLALVVGGAGLAAGGAALLGVGIRGRNQVEGARDGSEYGSVRAQGERARGLGYAGQVALGVGVAVAVTGVVLLVVSDPHDDDSTDGAARQPTTQLALRVGLGHVSLSGSF